MKVDQKRWTSISVLIFTVLVFAFFINYGWRLGNSESSVYTPITGQYGYGTDLGSVHKTGMYGEILNYSFIEEYPYEDVSEDEKNALIAAIHEEYRARAIYQKVIDKFGPVEPFNSIVNAEGTHIKALEILFKKYGIPVPEDDWADKVQEFESISIACKSSIKEELENENSYVDIIPFVENKDILAVFDVLQYGSSRHLRAFQMCYYNQGTLMWGLNGNNNI
jgi:hypothetical protein